MDVLKTTSRLFHLRDDVVGGPRDDLGRGAATHAVILTLAFAAIGCHSCGIYTVILLSLLSLFCYNYSATRGCCDLPRRHAAALGVQLQDLLVLGLGVDVKVIQTPLSIFVWRIRIKYTEQCLNNFNVHG